jgi:tRNA threonylcarbamoyl adenosine modification protein (Sua5/YciO/YrdC/YwlC family)
MSRRWTIDAAPSALQIHEIGSALLGGAVVLLPTDTIYGLHAVATDAKAVARIAELKGRNEQAKPFIVLAASIGQLTDLGVVASQEILDALGELWPGPLTAILRRPVERRPRLEDPAASPVASNEKESTLAVRIPDVAWLRALIERTGPLVSTSANRTGDPAIDRPSALARDLHDAVDIVDGGARTGDPSAILDLSGPEPRFIRERDPFFTQKVWKTLRKTA